jgi:hypothetical protein
MNPYGWPRAGTLVLSAIVLPCSSVRMRWPTTPYWLPIRSPAIACWTSTPRTSIALSILRQVLIRWSVVRRRLLMGEGS